MISERSGSVGGGSSGQATARSVLSVPAEQRASGAAAAVHESAAGTIRTAIVVEGGAMRGIFSAGVLDVLLEQGLDHFDLALGTSAGALNVANFLAGQKHRGLRCYQNIMTRPELFSVRRRLRGGHYMDLDWLWECFEAEDPLDEDAIARRGTELVSVATCATTGAPRYMTHRPPGIHAELKAGCALPFAYRGPTVVQGHAVVDGGLSDPIPVAEAYRRGARRLLVIRSRPAHVVKRETPWTYVMSAMLARHPGVAIAVRETPRRYRRAVEFLRAPPPDARIVQLAPQRPLLTRRTTQDRDSLQRDYTIGRREAEWRLGEIASLFE